jgi:FkbM family methyltransferase
VIAILDLARRARLRALLTAHLSNGAEVWEAHRAESALPPLSFRNGLVLRHGEGDAPLFLFFEIFANACYSRQFSTVEPGTTIIDIGANIGAFTLDCATRFRSVRIEAYEPNPRAFRILQENIATNGLERRVRAYPEAVGRIPGVLELWGSGSNITASAYPHASESRHPPTACPMVDLHTVLSRAGGYAGLVKVDAEGAEADILEGGRGVVRSVTQFVGEYHEDRVSDVAARCRALFEQSGFAFTLSSSRRCGPLFRARRID